MRHKHITHFVCNFLSELPEMESFIKNKATAYTTDVKPVIRKKTTSRKDRDKHQVIRRDNIEQ